MEYDQSQLPDNYARARNHAPAVTQQWMDAVATHVGGGPVDTILDLGCGTGRFMLPLAERFSARVVGIDPSIKMLSQAPGGARDQTPRIRLVRALAEALPLRDDSIDLVFISMVFHHFNSPAQAAAECRRVVALRGSVFLRTGTREQISRYAYVPFFPESVPLLEQRLGSIASQRKTFEDAGFDAIASGVILQEIAEDFGTYSDKLALGADSVLASLDPADFRAGLEALRAYARSPQGRHPVTEPIDYIVFSAR